MDPAVALVQAYLYANGYFTVTEYPVVETMHRHGYRTATDVDVMAVRFPGAGRLIPRRGKKRGKEVRIVQPDKKLRPARDRIDMIIGEVKEGRAELNHGARNPAVLRAALTRFGACTSDHADELVEDLVRRGRAHAPSGRQVRLMAFGSTIDPRNTRPPYTIITLGHVIEFLRGFAADHWDMLRHAHFKDPGLSFLMVLEKILRLEDVKDEPREKSDRRPKRKSR